MCRCGWDCFGLRRCVFMFCVVRVLMFSESVRALLGVCMCVFVLFSDVCFVDCFEMCVCCCVLCFVCLLLFLICLGHVFGNMYVVFRIRFGFVSDLLRLLQ